jgi:phenylacetate-coenzyme A ligase PaaK-like adenylate-forming protein
MASEKHNKKEEEKQEAQLETAEENLRRLLEDARCKSEAYRKILNSLNINTNKNKD